MATRLTDKIDSYNLKLNVKFDETFTGNTPTSSGTVNLPTTVVNYSAGVSGINKGPFPGQKAWQYNNSVNAAGQRYTPTTNFGAIFAPANGDGFTVGMWVKVNAFPVANVTSITRLVNSTATGSPHNLYNGFYIGYGENPANNKNAFNFYTADSDFYIDSDHNNQDLVAGRWYYIALRRIRTYSSGNTYMSHEVYVNGTLKATSPQVIDILPAWTFFWFGSATVASITNHQLASYHADSNTILDATAINNIWKAGAPIQVPVKYYDGSTWQTSSDKKVYDGSEWIPIYANRWDGSSWVAI